MDNDVFMKIIAKQTSYMYSYCSS